MVVFMTAVLPEHGGHPTTLATTLSSNQAHLPVSLSRVMLCSQHQCYLCSAAVCYFCALLQNGSTTVLWFFNLKRVKWNRKYLPWEHAEWDSTWVMLRTGDRRAMGLKTDRVAGCTQSFVSGWHGANTHGHHLIDVMLPPVDMWTALYSLIFKGLYGVVYMFPRGHRITYLPELAEQGMESIPPIARGSPSTPSIYILVSGKVARMKLSAFLYIWDFCI